MALTEKQIVEPCDKRRFESMYVNVPFVHEKGMIVRYTLTGEMGILATGEEEFAEIQDKLSLSSTYIPCSSLS